MNKWVLAALFILVFLFGVLPYFAQNTSFTGDTSQISPILQTLNVGAMRTDPIYSEDVLGKDGVTYTNTEKGVRSSDVIAEVNKQVMEQNSGKFEDEVIAIEFMLEDAEGNAIDVAQVKNGSINPLASKVGYIVNVYAKNAFQGNVPTNGLKPNAEPMSSTQYQWSLYTDAGEEVEFNDRDEELPTWQTGANPSNLTNADRNNGLFKDTTDSLSVLAPVGG